MAELPGAGAAPAGEAPTPHQIAAAARTLALLDDQAQGVRAELAKLRADLAQVQLDVSGSRAAQLLEANEQLVMTALRAEMIAEAAVSNLDKLARAAGRDPLTDTPNRALMQGRMEAAIAMARRHGTRLAVLFLDIDHFKQINDRRGHAAGDAVLQLVARRLESAVRDSDTVSRHGGDEFLVLLPEVAQASDAALIAAKMQAALAEPSELFEPGVTLAASLGVACYPEDGEDVSTLIARADAAMYRAKRRRLGSPSVVRARPVSAAAEAGAPALSLLTAASPAVIELAASARESQQRDLREANEQLVLTALTAKELEARAEEARRGQVKYLAMVAHELRNPLTPIRTAAELLHRAQPGDESLLMRLQAIIKRQVDHMSRLVEDLLDGSRVSAGKFRLERSSVELEDTLNQAVESCRPGFDKKQQRLVLRLPEGGHRVHGDPTRLAQIFRNLLDNASKYTPAEGEIVLALEAQARAVKVSIADNGIGISPEALPHIFDLFVQDTRALAVHSGGLGIGLAVVRELVEAHGGSVLATSAGTDQGSEFVVTLPVQGVNLC